MVTAITAHTPAATPDRAGSNALRQGRGSSSHGKLTPHFVGLDAEKATISVGSPRPIQRIMPPR